MNLVNFCITNQWVTKKSAAKYYDISKTCVYRVITCEMIVRNLVNKYMSADVYQQNISTVITDIQRHKGKVISVHVTTEHRNRSGISF